MAWNIPGAFILSLLAFASIACKTSSEDHPSDTLFSSAQAQPGACWMGSVRIGQVPGLYPGVGFIRVGARSADLWQALWAPFAFCALTTNGPDRCDTSFQAVHCADPTPAFRFEVQVKTTSGAESVTEQTFGKAGEPAAVSQLIQASTQRADSILQLMKTNQTQQLVRFGLDAVAAFERQGRPVCAALRSNVIALGDPDPMVVYADVLLDPRSDISRVDQLSYLLDRGAIETCEKQRASTQATCQFLPTHGVESSGNQMLYWAVKLQRRLYIKVLNADNSASRNPYPATCFGETVRYSLNRTPEELSFDL